MNMHQARRRDILQLHFPQAHSRGHVPEPDQGLLSRVRRRRCRPTPRFQARRQTSHASFEALVVFTTAGAATFFSHDAVDNVAQLSIEPLLRADRQLALALALGARLAQDVADKDLALAQARRPQRVRVVLGGDVADALFISKARG